MTGLSWRERLTVERHELTVAAVLLARVVDTRAISETDWQRLLLVKYRVEALAGAL